MACNPVTYRTRPVAIAAAERFWLTDEIDALPTANPLKTWACFMCLYARDVLTGVLPGPYSGADAELFARAALIPARGPPRCPCGANPTRSPSRPLTSRD